MHLHTLTIASNSGSAGSGEARKGRAVVLMRIEMKGEGALCHKFHGRLSFGLRLRQEWSEVVGHCWDSQEDTSHCDSTVLNIIHLHLPSLQLILSVHRQ